MLLSKIKKKTLSIIDGLEVVDFGFALPYSWVLIEGSGGRTLGVAMTLPEEIQRYVNSIDNISIKEFIERLDSFNVVERTLALAAVNAVSQYYLELSREEINKDVLELLPDDPGKIALIGNMPPIARELRKRGFEVYVFERNPKLWDRDTYSDALEYHLLPDMDVVIASGSCIVNGTLDMLLDRAKNVELFVLTGPTAQLLPEFLRHTIVTHIASMKVVDITKALLGLKLGSFRGFEGGTIKYIIEVP
ncbi:Rossmann-like domain-containing protein [Thermococcus sp.]